MHNLCAGLFLQAVVIGKEMGRHQQKSNQREALINLKINPPTKPHEFHGPSLNNYGKVWLFKNFTKLVEKKKIRKNPICPLHDVIANVTIAANIDSPQSGAVVSRSEALESLL
jgi:hypothetical protein